MRLNQSHNLLKNLILFLVGLSLLTAGVTADTNLSVNTYILHSEPYTPYQVWIVTLALGLTFLILSLLLTKTQNSDAFAALSIIPLFVSAWMTLQIDIPEGGIISVGNDTLVRTEHHIYSATILALIFALLGFVAVFHTYRLLTTDTGIEETYGERQKGYDENDEGR